VQGARSYDIDKWKVYEAYKKVKANGGSSGIDGIEIEAYEVNLKDNLYKFRTPYLSQSKLAEILKTILKSVPGNMVSVWFKHLMADTP